MERKIEKTNNQNLPFGHYVDAQPVQTHGLEGGPLTPPQYARAISDIHRDTDADDPETVDSASSALRLTDAVLLHVLYSAVVFLMPVTFFTTFLNIVFLQSPENYENGLFVANFVNSTLETNSEFVIEVNEEFVVAINRSLLVITTFALTLLVYYLAVLYNKDFPFFDQVKFQKFQELYTCISLVLQTMIIGSFFPGPVLLFTGKIPDFVAAFNIPETCFFPGNETAVTSLGLALASMLYVLEFCICCRCCVLVATRQDKDEI